MIAEIIVNSSSNELNRVFNYVIPEGMEVKIGMRVLIPFARRKRPEIGYVIGFKESSEYECKPIIRVVDRVVDEKRLELAKFVAKRYFCTLADSMKLLVPPGTGTDVDNVKAKTERWIKLNSPESVDLSKIKSDKQLRVIQFLMDNIEAPALEVLQFTDVTRDVFTSLHKKGIISFETREVSRNPFYNKNIHSHLFFDHILQRLHLHQLYKFLYYNN